MNSEAKTVKEISIDIVSVFKALENKLTNSKALKVDEIEIYINGTNGFIDFCGFNKEEQNTIDDTHLRLDCSPLWEDLDDKGYGATTFDPMIIKATKKAIKSDIGKSLKEKYPVILKTEDGKNIILNDGLFQKFLSKF